MRIMHANTSNQDIEKVGIFDYDGNMLHTNTLVHFIMNGKEVIMGNREFELSGSFKHLPVPFSTEHEWSAFRNMRDVNIYGSKGPEGFYHDTREAIEGGHIGKSFYDFLEHIKNGRFAMINTARGHSSQTLSEGVRIISEVSLSSQEKQIQIEKIRENFLLGNSMSNEFVLTKYFYDMLLHIGINDPFVLKMPNFIALENKENKTEAIYLQIQHFRKKMGEVLGNTYLCEFEIGFSDDSLGNVNAMIQYMKTNAIKLGVKPHVYYTGPTGLDDKAFVDGKIDNIDTELGIIQRITI